MWTKTKTSAMAIHGTSAAATPTKRKQEFDIEKEDKGIAVTPLKTSRWSNYNNTTATTDVTTTATITANRNNNPLGTIDNITRLDNLTPISCEPWNAEPTDNISRLQAVTVPDDPWGSGSSNGNSNSNSNGSNNSNNNNSNKTTTTLTTALLDADDLDDDDDFDDEYEEEQNIIPSYGLKYQCPPQRAYSPSIHGYIKTSFYSEAFLQQNGPKTPQNPFLRIGNFSWGNTNGSCCVPTEGGSYSQQMIRCAENGKSYLELGSSNFSSTMDAKRSKKCCDGRGAWCNGKSCYKEIRLRVRSISMFKLSRFRQISEQSLYRSVLICNTLKQIEKEIDLDSREACNKVNSQFPFNQTMDCARVNGTTPSDLSSAEFEHQPSPPSIPMNTIENRDFKHSSYNQKQTTVLFNSQSNNNSTTSSNNSNDALHSPYGHYSFRDPQSGRATPFPTSTYNADTDSGFGDDEANRSINWSSVLSLSSQSALDPLNNNDLFSTTTSSTSLSSSSTVLSGTTITTNFPLSSSSIQSSSSLSSTNSSFSQGWPSSGSTTSSSSSSSSSSSLEYGFLDMDLGLGSEFTELLPNCKLSSNDIFKSISSSLSPKFGHENDLESPAHIMVGS